MGNVSQITASRADQAQWTAAMQYNEISQEIERILPGNVISQWQYDITGRPTNHRISSQNRHTRRRVYQWDVNHRLKGMVNELTAGRTTYGYDEFSNLVWSNQGNQFDFLHRSVDDVGNLYETKDKKDRVYGAGSRLLETTDAKFSYDKEGNLVQKVEKNGDTWTYEYNGSGMMSRVIKQDQTEVTFKYDSLGRRIEKSSNEKTMQFVWDGNTILHEYFTEKGSVELESLAESQNNSEIPANLVKWVFNDGFVPSAKITSQGNYSIISDYLGTPVEAYDEEGNKVWSAELDIYGRVNEFTGEQDFIPFRYQGQYEDVEIGLYYNRFRYYDPEQGNYTQIDPIGLEGNNPTLYGYVHDPNGWVDIFGLFTAGQVKNFSNKGLGDWGEKIASKYLNSNGFEVLGSVQTKSNQGFDLVAIDRSTSEINVIEVKTSRRGFGSKSRMPTWTRNNIRTITRNVNGHWGNMPSYQKELMGMIRNAQNNGTIKNKLVQINVDKRRINIKCKN
ncbi:RHS repeat domain-containing protein [Solibacillus sp. FSL K6-1523]|uniref:RHS repeat domain-containing protein n=1 Tax=Solibacillus sp. FSL K6-1523 TaxID=2921471 RepID=UPI0030F76666